mgnify:CR=1 FL=1
MVKKVLSLLTVFVVTSQIILTPVTASAETKITKPTNPITTSEISSVTPNVAIAPVPGGTSWDSWYVSKDYIPANKPNSFISGLISLAVTNKANSIGAPSYVVYIISYLASQACVSMRTGVCQECWHIYFNYFCKSKRL